MQFLAPSLLLGLIAAAIPWLVHLIGKRRAVPVQFAAMQLLLRSEKRVSARRRLREILLLLSRTAIAASLPFIFARPFTERPADFAAASLDSQSAVVLLDDSASLRRLRSGTPLFDKAKDKALSLVRQFHSDSDLALVLASTGSTALVAELTPERSRLLQELERARCSARSADFSGAMRRAALILATSSRPKRRIFVVTDLQTTGWEQGTGLTEKDAPEVVVIDVAPEAAAHALGDNRAVVDVRTEPAPEAGPGGIAVTAEIAHFGGQSFTNLGVVLKMDGAVVTKSFVDLPANGRAKKRFVHTLAPGTGTAHQLEVEIDRDEFPLDDRRYSHFEHARTLRALVVNGDARTVRTEDETFFIEAALKSGDSGASVTIQLAEDVPLDALSSYTVIFLANVAQPSAALAAALSRYVESGGGVFISVGDRVDATVWNERLGNLLPQPMGLARTASALPGQNPGETVDNRPAERLSPLDRRHPLLSNFPAQGEGLASARFFKYMLLEPVPDSTDRSVILRFETGSPALVERQIGKGRVLLLSTTVDREWTDLPIRPGFLPLVQEATRRLMGASERGGLTSLLAGQPRQVTLTADDRRVQVTKPDGSVWVARHERTGMAGTALFADTNEPGGYRVHAAGPDGILVPRPGDGFVVNVDTRESDPARLPPERRPDRAIQDDAAGAPPKRRVELWHALAAVLIGFVFLESLLTLRWRRTVLVQNR